MRTDFTEVWAVPGQETIIDMIDSETGLTMVRGDDPYAVTARYPDAMRMTWDEWRSATAARQHTPIIWEPTTEERYEEMLNVLPPIWMPVGAFLVGEPSDHDVSTGHPRYQAYWHRQGAYLASSRPVTIKELKTILEAGHAR